MARRDHPLPEFVSAGQLAQLLGLTTGRLRQFVSDGTLARTADGRYPLAASMQAIMARKEAAAIAARSDSSLERRRAALARKAELEAARLDGKLISMVDAQDVLNIALGGLVSEMDGLPAQVTRDMQVRRKIEAAVDGAFDRARQRIADEIARLGRRDGRRAAAT
jgi:hypothetical protein